MQQVKTCQNQTKTNNFCIFINSWIECVQKATFYFGAKVSQVFSLKYDGNETKTVSEELIQDLRTSFEYLIKEADWMDEGKNILKRRAICQEYDQANPLIFLCESFTQIHPAPPPSQSLS